MLPPPPPLCCSPPRFSLALAPAAFSALLLPPLCRTRHRRASRYRVRANLHGLDSTRGVSTDAHAPSPSRPRRSNRRTEPSATALRVQGEGDPLHGIRRGAPRGRSPQSFQPLPPPLYRIGCHRASGSRVGAGHHGLHSVEGLQAALERAEAALCMLADAEQSRILIFRGPEVCQAVVGYLVIVMRKWRLILGISYATNIWRRLEGECAVVWRRSMAHCCKTYRWVAFFTADVEKTRCPVRASSLEVTGAPFFLLFTWRRSLSICHNWLGKRGLTAQHDGGRRKQERS